MSKSRSFSSLAEKAAPRRVDYHANQSDFLCVVLAAIGLSTQAISQRTGLTESQVMYRLAKAEGERKGGEQTARTAYRNGQGTIATQIITSVIGGRTEVTKTVVHKLEQRDLYSPKPTGVLQNEEKRKK